MISSLQQRLARIRRLLIVPAVLGLLAAAGAAPAARAAANVVTNLNDSGPGSLRQALADAPPGGTITFGVGGTIILTSGELVVSNDLTLSGPGAAVLGVSGNKANAALASRVIHNFARLTIRGLTIRDGDAGSGGGGGILNEGAGVLTVLDSLITNNTAQFGAGVYNSPGGSLTVVDSTLSANQTRLSDAGVDASGAGIYNAGPGGVATISGSTFFFNDAHDHGSALYNAATATLVDSTIALNQAAGAAAVYGATGGALRLNNVTIAGNSGGKQAAGLFSAGGSVDVANSVVAANTMAGSQPLPDCDGLVTSSGHNVVGINGGCAFGAGLGDQIGSAAQPIDPRLGPLQDNGGPTWTMLPAAGSPAIDRGSPAAPGGGGAACEATDQRGGARPVFGGLGAICDAGAAEAGAAILLAANSGPTQLGQPTSFSAGGLEAGFQYHWDFGDGAAADGNPAQHIYAGAGLYQATVTAVNGPVTRTATTLVRVKFPAPPPQPGLFVPLVLR